MRIYKKKKEMKGGLESLLLRISVPFVYWYAHAIEE